MLFVCGVNPVPFSGKNVAEKALLAGTNEQIRQIIADRTARRELNINMMKPDPLPNCPLG
jgi:hypothetical protein